MEKDRKFEPLGNWALVQPQKKVEKIGGILDVSDDAIIKTNVGTVVSIGPDLDGFNVGDELFYQEHGTVKINVNNQELALVNKGQLLGYFEK